MIRRILISKTALSFFVLYTIMVSTLFADPLFMQPLGTIIIDPGHGGNDPGAIAEISKEGTTTVYYEKDINLAIAEMVSEILMEDYPEFTVVMTRNDDSSISLWQRAFLANTVETEWGTSKVFISIHANAAPGIIAAYGFEVWRLYPYITHDFYSSDINESTIIKSVDKTNKELNRELDEADSILAECIEESLVEGMGEDIRNRGIKDSAFYVLKQTYMASILIETGFMSFDDELLLLIDPAYQRRLAVSIVDGIVRYVEKSKK